ncbi:MAG: IclR family transcriptional regulator [Steroidobacteraceae bacterium]
MAETSLEKMLSVLELIEERGQVSGMDEILDVLSLTRSTLYRYVRSLTDFGLIAATPGGGYALGPRIIELDYKIRTRDSLIQSAHPLMTQLVQAVPGIALLCRCYRDKVLCVHQVRGAVGFASTYERGRVRPLLRGAASRVILANMPLARITKLYGAMPEGFAEAGLGQSLKTVRATLRAIQKRGWESSEGQITPGVTGIAAPIFDEGDRVIGSLSLTVGRDGLSEKEVLEIATRIVFCTQIISSAVSAKEGAGALWSPLDLPAINGIPASTPAPGRRSAKTKK